MPEWWERAVQAEWILTKLRGIPNIDVDLFLGVPIEILEAQRAEQEAAMAALHKEAVANKHRRRGEKGPIDPKQAQDFFHEVDRSRMEVMADGGMGLPPEILEETEFSFPAAVWKGPNKEE